MKRKLQSESESESDNECEASIFFFNYLNLRANIILLKIWNFLIIY